MIVRAIPVELEAWLVSELLLQNRHDALPETIGVAVEADAIRFTDREIFVPKIGKFAYADAYLILDDAGNFFPVSAEKFYKQFERVRG